MSTRRTVSVLLGLASAGMLLGAFAGVVVIMTMLFAIDVRHGHLDLPLSWFAALLGALIGGTFGAVLAPIAAYTPCRQVPVGRLFTYLTIGTVVGGAAAALLVPSPAFVVLGGLFGFLIAGDRLAAQTTESAAPEQGPRAPAG